MGHGHQEETAFKSANIVMITAGASEMSEEFRTRLKTAKERRSVRMDSILLSDQPVEPVR